SASSDHTLRTWDLEAGTASPVYEVYSGDIHALAITTDGRALSGAADGAVRKWDLQRCRRYRARSGHTADISDITVTPDGRHAVSASYDCTLGVWELKSGVMLRALA